MRCRYLSTFAVAFTIAACALLASGAAPATEASIPVDVPRPQLAIEQGNGGVASFTCSSAASASQTSEPDIPWLVFRVLLPPGADPATVAVESDFTDYVAVAGNSWDVEPVEPMVTHDDQGQLVEEWPPGKTIVDGRDTAIYGTNAEWPGDDVRLLSAGKLRKWVMVDVAVPLVQYNPVAGTLRRFEGGSLTVSFDDLYAGGNWPVPSRELASNAGLEQVRELVINFEQIAPVYNGASAAQPREELLTAPGYVIITRSELVAVSTELANFVLHKEMLGWDVTVATEADFGGGTGDTAAENIRAWLEANYVDLNIEYVLFIGSPAPIWGEIPMKMTSPRGGGWVPTDFYYADLSSDWDLNDDGYYGSYPIDLGPGGIDRHAEVLVGRIPIYETLNDPDPTDLDSILFKLMRHDLQSDSEAAWRRNALLPMHIFLEEPPAAYELFSWYGQAIKNSILEPEGWSYHRIYTALVDPEDPPETSPCTIDTVTDIWSAGTFGLIVWGAHGAPYIAAHIIDSSHVQYLNDDYPGFTFQCSCNTAAPEGSNLAYKLLVNGCVNTVGATRSCHLVVPEVGFGGSTSAAGVGYGYAKGLVRDQVTSGEALYAVKTYTDLSTAERWANLLMFNIYGDPASRMDPLKLPTYVNATTGDDAWDGLTLVWDGVHGPKRTIKGGISARTGDHVVHVAAGVYSGTGNTEISFAGRAIELRATEGAENTVIDCGSQARAFTFKSGETSAAIVDGFTIRNGASDDGGAIYCSASSPRITRCLITDCVATAGGAIYCADSDPVITDCTITSCSATKTKGGALLCVDSDPILINCLIADCSADGGGHAVAVMFSDPEFRSCTIADNGAGGLLSGIDCSDANPTFLNTILWNNGAQEFALSGSSAPTLNYCDVRGGWTGSGDNNIDADPVLASDWHLLGYSPCKNAGTQDGAPPVDIDGEMRGWGGGIDIGADEFYDADADQLGDWSETHTYGTAPHLADTDEDWMLDGYEARYPQELDPLEPADGKRDSDSDGLLNYEEGLLVSDPGEAASPTPIYVDIDNAGDPSQDGSAAHPFAAIQDGVDAADGPTVVLIEPGTYIEQVTMTAGVGLLGSAKGDTIVTPPSAGLGATVAFPYGDNDGVLVGLTIVAGTTSGDAAVGSIGSNMGVRACICEGGANGISVASHRVGRIFNCLTADHTNAGIVVSGRAKAVIVNCTVVDNAVGIQLPSSDITITNTIVWDNGDDLSMAAPDRVTVSYCDIEDGDFMGERGTFSADPLFVVGWLHDYYLRKMAAMSPCIDAGSDTALALGLDALTTTIYTFYDTGVVDLGFHTPIPYVPPGP